MTTYGALFAGYGGLELGVQSVLGGHETWRESALCAQTDPEVFFPPVGSTGGKARRICRQCPVTAECLEVALSRPAHSDEGIWGGTTPKERRAIRAERGAA